jgi:hypothetical protein
MGGNCFFADQVVEQIPKNFSGRDWLAGGSIPKQTEAGDPVSGLEVSHWSDQFKKMVLIQGKNHSRKQGQENAQT